MSIVRHYVMAAGGTGGHMVPAHALAAELIARGHRVALVTDERGTRLPGLFEGVPVHVMPAGRIEGGPIGWIKAWLGIRRGRAMARRLYEELQPTAVVGFGGYPAYPALLGALDYGCYTAVHEQNAVLGRVNRLLARRVDAIVTAYARIDRLAPRHEAKVHLVGNPVRESVRALGREVFPAPQEGGHFRLLVTGGSQGATILSTVVPAALALLPPSARARLDVVQQARPEDLEQVRAAYAAAGIDARLSAYIEDMPAELAAAALVIGRAGASTIAELTVAGRPAILVPLPSAMDDHQTSNAREMAEGGGAIVMAQPAFTADALARAIERFMADPEGLIAAAAHAKALGHPNATQDLADLIEGFGRPPVMDAIGDEARGFEGTPAPVYSSPREAWGGGPREARWRGKAIAVLLPLHHPLRVRSPSPASLERIK